MVQSPTARVFSMKRLPGAVSTALKASISSMSVSSPNRRRTARALRLLPRFSLTRSSSRSLVSNPIQGPLTGIMRPLPSLRPERRSRSRPNQTPGARTIWWMTVRRTPLTTKPPERSISGILHSSRRCSTTSPLSRSVSVAFAVTRAAYVSPLATQSAGLRSGCSSSGASSPRE